MIDHFHDAGVTRLTCRQCNPYPQYMLTPGQGHGPQLVEAVLQTLPSNGGAQGPTGDKGPVGDKGATGDPGAKGADGNPATVWPVGSVFISVVSTNPATLLGIGTWVAFGTGRVLIGVDGGQAAYDTAEETGGSATHGHTVTQPADHAALSHAGATVGNHTFTQPSAHSDHAALAHSAHAGAAVANHAVTQPGAHSAHAVTQPGAHSNHVITQPNAHADVLNHVHVEQLQGGTTGTTTGTFLMGSAALGGSLRSAAQSTLNPSANGVASQAHAGAAADAHSAHSGTAVDAHSAHAGTAVDAHGVTQPNAHSDHAAQSHTAHAGGAVDAHTVGQATTHGVQSHSGAAVDTVGHLPPFVAVYMWKRIA